MLRFDIVLMMNANKTKMQKQNMLSSLYLHAFLVCFSDDKKNKQIDVKNEDNNNKNQYGLRTE